MKIVEMTYEVCETCQNGKERVLKKKVYSRQMFRFEDGKRALENKGYYNVVMLKADWKDIVFIED